MRRGEMIQVRVFPDELNTIKQNANAHGFNFVSDYIRSLAINGTIINNTKPEKYI
jgi:predicted DNA binding CopG/RHH family protein